MEREFYTTGELAKLTGVSYKTIRHYNKLGLLKPEKYTEGGYSQYSMKSVELLQRILMLKYLNFTLDEVQQILLEEDVTETFYKQEKLLMAQREHLNQVITAVREMQQINDTKRWEKMLMIIRMTQQKEEIVKQYMVKDNLQKRINIHAYSTSKINWYQWIFHGLQLTRGMKILEIGCGNGMLWIAMHKELPRDLQIILTDSSENMLQSAKNGISQYTEFFQEMNIQFTFMQKDAENFQIEEEDFDRIIANHMLYHVTNHKRHKLLETCKKRLKDDGMFYASTVGSTHLRELFTLVEGFHHKIDTPGWMTENFELENGGKQLEKVFSSVTVEEQENDLLVPNPQAVYDYIESWPGNAKEVLKGRKNDFMNYLKSKVSEDAPYFIHKSTGAFKAYKR